MKKLLRGVCVALIAVILVVGLVGCNSPKSLAKQMYNNGKSFEQKSNSMDIKEAEKIQKKYRKQFSSLRHKVEALTDQEQETFRQEYRKLTGIDYKW
jgi:altronate dehydratase